MNIHPGVRVKPKQETKGGLKCQLGNNDLSSDGTVAVNCVDQRDIGSLSNSEVD